MANLDKIELIAEKSADASSFMVGTDEFAVPLGDLIDVAAEIYHSRRQGACRGDEREGRRSPSVVCRGEQRLGASFDNQRT